MNRKQKMIKKMAKRAKAKRNKVTPPKSNIIKGETRPEQAADKLDAADDTIENNEDQDKS